MSLKNVTANKGWRKIWFKIVKSKKTQKSKPIESKKRFDKGNSRRRSGFLKSTIHFIGFYFWEFILERVDIFRKKTAMSFFGG